MVAIRTFVGTIACRPASHDSTRTECRRPDPQDRAFCFVGLISRYSKLSNPREILEKQAGRQGGARNDKHPAKVRDLSRRLGQATIDRLVADYQSGTPTTQLMTTYQLSKTAVLKLLKDAGIVMRRRPMTEEQVNEAVELYRSGRSLATLSSELELPRESLRRAIIEVGVQMRPRGSSRS